MSLLKDIIDRFIFLGADINCCDEKGCTPLHHASSRGEIQMAWCLLQSGAKTDVRNFNGDTPLFVAYGCNLTDTVRLLVYYEMSIGNYNFDGCEIFRGKYTFHDDKFDVHGRYSFEDEEWFKTMLDKAPHAKCIAMVHSLLNKATIDSKISLNKALLMLATVDLDEDVSKLFINLGVVNTCDDNGWTSLHHASSMGWFKEVWELLQSGADKNIKSLKGETPLMLAVEQSGDKNTVKFLLHHGVDGPNFDGGDKWASRQLHSAARTGGMEMVQWLVSKGVDINSKGESGETPLMIAASYADKDIAELLINAGADIKYCNHNGWTALQYAVRGGHVEIVQLLVSRGAVFDFKCNSTLIIAITQSHLNILELLATLGANFQIRSKRGWTLLHYAAWMERIEIIQFLLNKGLALDSVTVDGETPLILAAAAKHIKVVELLMGLGADINGCSIRNKWTLLHYASNNKWIEMVETLVKKGVDMNARSRNGRTPLILALQASAYEIATYLLKQGADCVLKDKRGQTALHVLLHRKIDLSLISIFIEKGAWIDSVCYDGLMSKLETQLFILRDMKVCSQMIINNVNNKYIPELYEVYANTNRLPSIDKLKIGGDRVEMVSHIEQIVKRDIKRRGYCKVLEVRLLPLSILSLQSFSKYVDTESNRVLHSKSNRVLHSKSNRVLYSKSNRALY